MSEQTKAPLAGEIVCVSGKFEGYTQEEMTSLVESNGATCVSSVTKKTTMLVTGDKVGATKLTKAQELGVRIVPQEEFFQMVHGLEEIDTEKKTASLQVEILPSGEGCVCVGIADKKATNIEIPSTMEIEGKVYKVTEIGEKAFYDCENLTSVTIPDSVTVIGEEAFRDCSNLTSVTIPASVTEIGWGAFYNCSNLTSVTIPDSVTEIGTNAFGGCPLSPGLLLYANGTKCYGWVGDESKLLYVIIPDSVTEIGDYAFFCCPLPSGLLLYANGTKCYGWVGDRRQCISVTIPDSVTEIAKNAFSGCENLTSVTIPDSVTEIGNSAFSGCPLPSGLLLYANGTKCYGWVGGRRQCISVTIPDSVTEIGDCAFSWCDNLETIKISKNSNLDLSVFGEGVAIIRE